jgi:hypothetical protein
VEPDDLYGLPLDRFVPERGALARSLRAAGRREQAAEVAGLRKPSVVAWAVNQLVRTQSRALAELYAAGDKLREAQTAVLAGRGDARSLHTAADRERVAVDALVIGARGLLTSEGHELSGSTIDRVAETVHAAALDDGARVQVRQGRLERELRHVGLGVGAALAPGAPAPAPGVRPAAKAKPRSRDTAPAERAGTGQRDHEPDGTGQRDRERIAQERVEAERVERERAQARRAARLNESQARRSTDLAARAVRVAEERRERAAKALRDAEQALAEARSQAEAAENRHRRAEQELGSL